MFRPVNRSSSGLQQNKSKVLFARWNRIWSMVWYSLPHVHVASSLRWNRCRYAFVIPCPVSTADIFGVSFILDLSLSWTVEKYCLVAEAFWLFVHSRCHLCLASWYSVFFGILVNTFSVPPHRAASFASLSAISLPSVPAWALTQENFILHSLLSRLATCFLISSTRNEWFFALRSESRETRLSVYIMAVSGLILYVCMCVCMYVCMCVSMYVCMYVLFLISYFYVCFYLYVYVPIYLLIHSFLHMFIRLLGIYMFIYLNAYLFLTYLFIYLPIYIYLSIY